MCPGLKRESSASKGRGLVDLVRVNGTLSYQRDSLVAPWDIELPEDEEREKYENTTGSCMYMCVCMFGCVHGVNFAKKNK